MMIKAYLKKYLAINPYTQYLSHRIYAIFLMIFGSSRVTLHSNESSNFIFIVGAGRSGNTLLRKLLIERCRIFIPPETYILPDIIKIHLKTPGLSWSEKVNITLASFEYHSEFFTFDINNLQELAHELKLLPQQDRSIENIIIFYYAWLARKKNIEADYYGDKTPLNTLNLGLLSHLFPKARYIYIERDGVDVAASYKQAGIYPDIISGANRWLDSKKSWLSFKKTIASDRYIEIRYEALVTNPDKIITTVLQKIGVPLREAPIDLSSALGDTDKYAHHKNIYQKINIDSIGKGRASLSLSDINTLQPLINEELQNSGYAKI